MKRISFVDKPIVIHVEKNDECRNGIDWIRMSFYRRRFEDRITEISNAIGYILEGNHRDKIRSYILHKKRNGIHQSSVMDKICAIVDAQGFFVNNRFYVREFTLCNNTECISEEFSPDIKYTDLSNEDKSTANFCTGYIHGIIFNPIDDSRLKKSSTFAEYIKEIHSKYSTEDKPNFGVKNDHFKEYLIECEIPVIDLNQFDIPSIKDFDTLYFNQAYVDLITQVRRETCKIHDFKSHYFRCAFYKCMLLWQCLKGLLNESTNN